MKNTLTKSSSQSLYDLLSETELLAYYSAFKTKLKIDNADHLKYVAESDLSDIGMSKPEQRRLFRALQKRYPNSVFGKLKKKVFDKVHTSPTAQVDGYGSPRSLQSSPRAEQHIIPSSRIIVCQKLGGGEFGDVWQGVWSSNSSPPEKIQVAVKCIPPEKMAANPLNFLQEAAIMHRIEHENIVRLFGVVLEPKTIMLVTELAPLRSLLECLKQSSSKISFTVLRLCDFAEQICAGMTYLEMNRLIHRDLAARNILAFSVDRVKVSDFGLSRALGAGEDYYRGNFGVSLKLPIAWCAPECIKYLKFTSASDVWSFGVTLWEMFTYGFQPWVGMTGRQILDFVDKPNSKRLDTPDDCPLEYYNLMLQTWEHEPGNRPKFADILTVLPEIRPIQVKTIVDCCDGQLDHLQYKSGDLITVLSKRPREYPDGFYWKGVLNNGRTGLFAPSNTVAHLTLDFNQFSNKSSNNNNNNINLMTSSVSSTSVDSNQSLSSSRSFGGTSGGLRSSISGKHNANKQKLSRRMISGPQNDFRHTGHVGLDGSSFGNVDFLPDNKSHLPLQVVAPFNVVYVVGTDDKQSPCCFGRPVINSEHSSPVNNNNNNNNSDHRLHSTTSETAALLPHRSSSAMSDGSAALDLDAPVFECKKRIGGGTLLDEVFDALNMLEMKENNNTITGQQNLAADFSEPSSPLDNNDQSDGTRLLGDERLPNRTVRYYSPKNIKQQAAVKPMSASDAKMLNDLTTLAGKISEKALTKERERQEKLVHPDEEVKSERSPTATLKLKLQKFRRDSPPLEERKKFTDSLPRTNAIRISPEAENAYKSLIDAKPTAPTLIPAEDASWQENNPLRLLRNDGTALVRSFRTGSTRKLECPPPPRRGAALPATAHAPPIPPKSFKSDKSSILPAVEKSSMIPIEKSFMIPVEKRSTLPQVSTNGATPKSPPPPVPPKPKIISGHGASDSTSNGVHCVQNNNVPSQINYARLQTNTETNGSANNEQHNGQQSSYDECPSMTLESVDKYQLLNFVLSPLRSNEQRMETNGTAAS